VLFRLADLVVIPVRPSPADLWAVSATVEQLKADNVPFVFVLNAIKSAASITAQAAAALSHHGRVAQTFVADRTAYAAAMVDGSAAQELQPRGPAAREMADLLVNIKACMHANMKG
jgi:chromosome partitioning protein